MTDSSRGFLGTFRSFLQRFHEILFPKRLLAASKSTTYNIVCFIQRIVHFVPSSARIVDSTRARKGLHFTGGDYASSEMYAGHKRPGEISLIAYDHSLIDGVRECNFFCCPCTHSLLNRCINFSSFGSCRHSSFLRK